MALQHYSSAAIFVDGSLLSEASEVNIETNPALVEIMTMQKGFAGVSPGAEKTSISVTSAVPRVGFELDYLDKCQGVKVVEVTVFAHGKKTTCKGFLSNVKQTYGVNKEATVSFDFIGQPVEESTL